MNNIYFLAGLPRSGNTLLSSLLNQHPSIYSSPISDLMGGLWKLEELHNEEHGTRSIDNFQRTIDAQKGYAKLFYQNINKPVIIDREKSWATPGNYNLAKRYITNSPKMIVTVRNVLDIVASLVNLNKPYYLDQIKDFYGLYYRDENDMIAEFLLQPNGFIDKDLLGIANAISSDNRSNFHLVEYDDLILNPEKTMNDIYDFLEIPKFDNDFENIEKVEVDFDEAVGFPSNTHEVYKKITRSSTSPEKVFSKSLINKYSDVEFWKQGSAMKVKDVQQTLPNFSGFLEN